jgi:uncharacterized caspase-like protein
MRFQPFIVAMIMLAAAAAPALADKRAALVIGNAAYRNMTPLQNPGNDAADVAAALRRLGFDTTEAADLDRSGMNDALDRFSRQADGADIAIVYYSGHGMQFNGANYLLPVDARLDSAADITRFRLMPLDDVLEALRRVHGVAVLVLDACRNNPVENEIKRRLTAASGDRGDAMLTRGLKPQSAGNGLLIAYATQANDVAADGAGRHSPFTSAFLDNVETPGIDLRMMMLRVQDEVDGLTGHRQRPEVSNSIVGEFMLKPAGSHQDGNAPDGNAKDAKTGMLGRLAGSQQEGPSPSGGPSQTGKAPSGEAAGVWAATKDTTSLAVLNDFIRQFGDTPYGSMARARREELSTVAASRDQGGNAKDASARTDARTDAGTGRTQVENTAVDTQSGNTRVAALPPPVELPRPRAAGESCSGAGSGTRYCASSVLSPQLGNTYGVAHLFDGNRSAAWVEGAPGQGIGEWITVDFDAARTVRSIAIDNGYQKNSDIFYKNSRVRKLTLVFSGGERKSLTLQDQFGQQTFRLDRPIRARWIQFVIDDVYPGNKYQDTAISKLSVVAE